MMDVAELHVGGAVALVRTHSMGSIFGKSTDDVFRIISPLFSEKRPGSLI